MKKIKIKIRWSNNNETYALEGDDWFSTAEKAGLEIPTGCLTGSCGACEIDVNGETVRACISSIKSPFSFEHTRLGSRTRHVEARFIMSQC